MEGAWFEPINYFPQLYVKIEWGVKLLYPPANLPINYAKLLMECSNVVVARIEMLQYICYKCIILHPLK
jgi:hypothetical protein